MNEVDKVFVKLATDPSVTQSIEKLNSIMSDMSIDIDTATDEQILMLSKKMFGKENEPLVLQSHK